MHGAHQSSVVGEPPGDFTSAVGEPRFAVPVPAVSLSHRDEDAGDNGDAGPQSRLMDMCPRRMVALNGVFCNKDATFESLITLHPEHVGSNVRSSSTCRD